LCFFNFLYNATKDFIKNPSISFFFIPNPNKTRKKDYFITSLVTRHFATWFSFSLYLCIPFSCCFAAVAEPTLCIPLPGYGSATKGPLVFPAQAAGKLAELTLCIPLPRRGWGRANPLGMALLVFP
jgi:hypothetical protein